MRIEAMDDVAGNADAMVLVRVDNELGRNSFRFKCLVHLFCTDNRHIKICLAGHKKGRSFDFLNLEERVGEIKPLFGIVPGFSQFIFILGNILIGTIEGKSE